MAPKRNSKSVYRRLSTVSEVSPSKDGANSKTSMQRKRKLSDMLGSQWTKEELERFYEAFRKYGKDWKKVGAAVRNRSVDMVETLYTMNRAYLSLPEGTASVVGLIAMMTDHYCNLEDSDSERESNDGVATSKKSQKRARGDVRTSMSKASEEKNPSHSQPSASNSDYFWLWENKQSGGGRPWTVGKRTPRFPVSFSRDKGSGERFLSPSRPDLKRKVNGNDDDVAHEVALALAEVSQKGDSPQESQTLNRRTVEIRPSPVQSGNMMDMELTRAKFGCNMEEDGSERHVRSSGAGKSMFAKDRRRKKSDMDHDVGNHLDDIREANSGAEGPNFGVKVGKSAHTSPQVSRRKSKKISSTDEGSEFDALQCLADLSLMMPTTSENESSVQANEEDDNMEKYELSEVRVKGNKDVAKMSKIGKFSGIDSTGLPEAHEEHRLPSIRFPRKKGEILPPLVLRTEIFTDTRLSEPQEVEAVDAGKKLMSSIKRSSVSTLQKNQGKAVKHSEKSSSSVDHRGEKDESARSSAQLPMENQVDLSDKSRRRRKSDIQKPQNLRELGKSVNKNKLNLSNPSVHNGAPDLKVQLSNCLSSYRVRRRCVFEWFYSAIDYPWFAKREFVEYLNHVGLGHVPRLTRVEWGVIRSSLGKPRRFSEQFLKEEKEKLNQYRDSVREHYSDLREGIREGLPTDLARPLSVGQRVIAIHPRTREISDGNVLTVDHNRCRVQFDRPELGVEFVLDIDCMPSNPVENMPASLARNTVTMDKLFASYNELRRLGQNKDHQKHRHYGETFKHADVPSHVHPAYSWSNSLKQEISTIPDLQAKPGIHEGTNGQAVVNSTLLAQLQSKEADVQALAELTCALDKKEAVVSELRHMNNGVFENQKEGDTALKNSESFKKQYAAVFLQLNAVNDQVSRALQDLRKHNNYIVSSPPNNYIARSPPSCPESTMMAGDSGQPVNSFVSQANHVQESISHVHEIVESSRRKARTMVDAAALAMSSFKGEGNKTNGIGEAIDYISKQLQVDDSFAEVARSFTSTDPINGNQVSSDGLQFELKNVLGPNESQIPSELISNCVATLLMIQKCTERQFPPADVAQILDSAALSLKPRCSQNLVVYGEIQKCMGILRNQILGLIPT